MRLPGFTYLIILCKSKRSARRTLENITPFIESKLFLKINKDKTVVEYAGKVKFLGFTFYQYKGKARVRIHPKAVAKMKRRIKEMTARSNGMSNDSRKDKLKSYLMGWVNYFKIADMKKLLMDIDEWMRRRIRMVYWKQWKRVRTRFKMLQTLGIYKQKAWEFANTRKGHWRISGSPILSKSLNNDKLKEFGFIFFSDYYRQVTA